MSALETSFASSASKRPPPPRRPPTGSNPGSNGDNFNNNYVNYRQKTLETAAENSQLRNLLSQLRVEDELKIHGGKGNGDPGVKSIRPPPPGPRGRGLLSASLNDSMSVVGSTASRSRPPPPKALRSPLEKKILQENSPTVSEDMKAVSQKVAFIPEKTVSDLMKPKMKEFDILDYVKSFPHGMGQFLDTTKAYEINKLQRPIGITLNKKIDKIIISEQGNDTVKMYTKEGKVFKTVNPDGKGFKKPSDMVALNDGRFAVRDDNGIQFFDENGEFVQRLCEDNLGRIYGLTASKL